MRIAKLYSFHVRTSTLMTRTRTSVEISDPMLVNPPPQHEEQQSCGQAKQETRRDKIEESYIYQLP